MTFDELFRTAMTQGSKPSAAVPYPYQVQFANDALLPQLLNVPTGTGKTATVILGWLFRRREHPDETVRAATPRRLVYCLPMRTLVEQTRDNAVKWLQQLKWFEGRDRVAVHVLMGGDDITDWRTESGRDANQVQVKLALSVATKTIGIATDQTGFPDEQHIRRWLEQLAAFAAIEASNGETRTAT